MRKTLLTILISIIGCIIFSGCKNKEVFSDVRAYRTAIDLDMEYYSEVDGLIAVDPPGTGNNDELRREAAKAFDIINAERATQNLEPLKWDNRLETCAWIRSEEISYHFDNDHVRPSGQYWYSVDPGVLLGENIYKGRRDAHKALRSWMENPADRQNFLCEYFTKMAISISENDKGEYCWAIMFGADTINITFVDKVQTASVWIIADTDNNRHTSVWGTAMMKPDELGKEYKAGIPKAKDDKYLFRMIDDDGIYYDTEIEELHDGWKLILYVRDGKIDPELQIYDENDELIRENPVFSAAL